MKFTITAVIPVAQYGNIQPSIEVEAETYEQAYAEVMPKIEHIWNKYVESGKQLSGGDRKLVKAFVGGSVYYDDFTHTYTNEAGEVYLSGSKYAAQFEKPFDKAVISEKMAAKYNVKPEHIVDMWELKGEVSRNFGTALHGALELYGKYNGLAIQLDRDTHLHDHPIIKQAVESFYAAHKEQALCEVFVVDHEHKHVGQIDRLVILDKNKKICRVEDYKTNADITSKLEVYWKQLEFYGDILRHHGWQVEPPVIHHWNGEWKEYVLDTV